VEQAESDVQVWVADLRDMPATSLFRCDCAGAKTCDYHAADWPLILAVVLEEFRTEYGDGATDLGAAIDVVVPRIEMRLKGRRHRRSLRFAQSLFADPVLATPHQWTNGQHRSEAALAAGCHYILFAG
jgi:hypothetical protein